MPYDFENEDRSPPKRDIKPVALMMLPMSATYTTLRTSWSRRTT